MASLEEIRNERIKKLELLIAEGVNPFPVKSGQTHSIPQALKNFKSFSDKEKKITLTGRVRALRGQGAILFFNLDDGLESIQGLVKKDELDEKLFNLFSETVDVGDFLEVSGVLFETKRKEKTILVKKWKMLAKSLRSLPDKWHGLSDVEERFRKRYLDSLSSPEVKDRFLLRSKIIKEIRNILDKNDFIEVETPMLQNQAGGATAKPFKTHHNALDIDLYLRIAPELFLKKMLIGGFPRVYEIARNFRNEGIDNTHNPEFTMLEFYEAFSDTEKQRLFVENLLKQISKNVFGQQKIKYNGHEIDLSQKFSVVSFVDLLKKEALISDVINITRDELALKAHQFGITVLGHDSKETILDNIYKKVCRPKIIQPTFIINYPKHYLPLAKMKEGDDNFVDAFQLVIGGVELAKGFSELNDPIDQRDRFLTQENRRKAGDDEAQMIDESFIESLEYGMPPAGGVGIGIDRLVMLLTDTKNIKEVIFFPTMRPKEQGF